MTLQKILNSRVKKINKTKWLEKHYGGQWKYVGWGRWECSDGQRYVQRTSQDCSNDWYDEFHIQHWLYGDGTPKLINWV